MKWTTTIDFLDYYEGLSKKPDVTVLQTGIVDWSPRPQQSAINDLYNNQDAQNLDNVALNTRDYSQKVVNNKKASFDRVSAARQ